MNLLDGQGAIVTGAGQGIGQAIAQRFLENGASVVMADVDEERLAELASSMGEYGERVTFCPCDVTNIDSHEVLLSHCLDRFGVVDVLVNNAGINIDKYMPKMSVDDFDAVVDVSLKGAWLGIRTVSPGMRERGSGSIINMSSLAGKIGNPGQTNYSAAKAGLIGLTKAAAKELGGAGVRVNAVQPGLIRTAMTLKMKPGSASEVADAVLFLASPLASYVSGAVLEVSGGRGI
ncbi:SDR family oxidoreductase [Rhodococcus jostii]|uniref:3-oxoacyl-[acyl-carrier-protein] reductase MabA n=1 Tax=Rhodococcus jostii TaxID=132919 RepID=A0A1H4JLX7_RHOJO|nr:SDR family NAD(P)-dependent oxidoreductase [Rhodococcus jostii]SEB47334.1 3-oxoacyl-[acyl-carrier protein] reductase [Rhodococcus jostii]